MSVSQSSSSFGWLVTYKWRVKPGYDDAFVNMWRNAFAQTTYFFEWKINMSDDGIVHLITRWESKEMWRQCMLGDSMQPPELSKLVVQAFEPECTSLFVDDSFASEQSYMDLSSRRDDSNEAVSADPLDPNSKRRIFSITIVEARDLRSALPNGMSDPYCTIKIAGQRLQRTTLRRKSLQPRWGETFFFYWRPTMRSKRRQKWVRIKVLSRDTFVASRDRELGRVRIDLRHHADYEEPAWLPLLNKEYHLSKRTRGELRVQVQVNVLPGEPLARIPKMLSLRKRPEEQWVKYADIRKTLQTGDLVYYASYGIAGGVIRFYTRGAWSHVGMVVKVPQYDMILLWESHPNTSGLTDIDGQVRSGVQIVNLSRSLTLGYYKRISFRRLHVERTPEMMQTLLDTMTELKGKGYTPSAKEFIISGGNGRFGINSHHLNHVFCTGMIAEAFIRMGLLTDKISSNNYSPADFDGLSLLKGELGPELRLLRRYNKRTKAWDIYFDEAEAQTISPEEEEAKAQEDEEALADDADMLGL